jgi:hypothetical protein
VTPNSDVVLASDHSLISDWAENVLMYLVGKFKTVKAAYQVLLISSDDD